MPPQQHHSQQQQSSRPAAPASGTASKADTTPSRNLFIAGLARTVDDRALAALCAPHGRVVSAKVMVDLHTARSRGFGFVLFDTVDAAIEARRQLLSGPDRRIAVEFSTVHTTDHLQGKSHAIYVRNIPTQTTAAAIRAHFERSFGPVKSVSILADTAPGASGAFVVAHVTFLDAAVAERAERETQCAPNVFATSEMKGVPPLLAKIAEPPTDRAKRIRAARAAMQEEGGAPPPAAASHVQRRSVLQQRPPSSAGCTAPASASHGGSPPPTATSCDLTGVPVALPPSWSAMHLPQAEHHLLLQPCLLQQPTHNYHHVAAQPPQMMVIVLQQPHSFVAAGPAEGQHPRFQFPQQQQQQQQQQQHGRDPNAVADADPPTPPPPQQQPCYVLLQPQPYHQHQHQHVSAPIGGQPQPHHTHAPFFRLPVAFPTPPVAPLDSRQWSVCDAVWNVPVNGDASGTCSSGNDSPASSASEIPQWNFISA